MNLETWKKNNILDFDKQKHKKMQHQDLVYNPSIK